MVLPADILALKSGDQITLRNQPLVFKLSVPHLVSQDGMDVVISLHQSVRIVDSPADRAMLKEQLLNGSEKLSIDQLHTILQPLIHQALSQLAIKFPADQLVSQSTSIESLVLKTLNQFGFGCGLEFLAPIRAAISCPGLSLQRATQRIELDRSELVERAGLISDRIRHLGSANLLRTDEQASLLPILMKSQPPRPIYLAVGSKVLWIEPQSKEPQPLSIPPSIGPFRSLRKIDDNLLLIGGQLGSMIHNPDAQTLLFSLEGTQSNHGINSILIHSSTQRLLGTHRDLGLLQWEIDSKLPLPPIRHNYPLRNLCLIGNSVFVTSDNQLLKLQSDLLEPVYQAASPILRLLPTADSVWLVLENGSVDRLDPVNPAHRLGGFARNIPILHANLLEISGLSALAICPSTGPVQIVSTTGQPLLELLGPYHGVRMITSSGGWFFGVSSDRQQLLGWDVSSLSAPRLTLHIAGRFGNRIADIC